jgi:hypothetical protein
VGLISGKKKDAALIGTDINIKKYKKKKCLRLIRGSLGGAIRAI